MLKRYMTCGFALLASLMAEAKVAITESGGWFESAYVKWTNDLTTYAGYNVYYKAAGASAYTQLDKELVRNYVSYGRADVLGITAGNYVMKVVPVKSDGTEDTAEAAETGTLGVTAHDRTGFAFSNLTNGTKTEGGLTFNAADGIGAYKNDGTLKDNARVIYVTADNAKTVSLGVIDGKNETTYTGIQSIITAHKKGRETRPLDIRIVGAQAENPVHRI